MAQQTHDLKKLLESNKLIIGSDRTLKLAKQGKIKTIFVASNIPAEKEQEIMLVAKALNIEVVKLEDNSKQFGIKLGKPFTVLVAGEAQ